MRKIALLAAGLFIVACGSSNVDPTGPGGAGGTGAGNGPGATTGTGGNLPGTKSFTVTFDALSVPAGTEDTKCVVKRLGNDEVIHVNKIHNVLPTGSHHLIVYRTADTEEKLTPYSCMPFADTLDPTKGSPLMVTQKHDEVLTLPNNVGFTLQPGVMVRLEMHYINTTTAPLDVSATSTFTTMPDADFKDEADFLFVGSPDINLAPMSAATLGPVYLPLPADLAGSKFFGITGHTHQFGKNVTVGVAPGAGQMAKSVYDVPNWQWDEPATVYHDPPFEIPSGGGFSFTCQWNNTSANQVGFGESANDEMCFFWAYYYPSKGAKVCAHTDQFGGFDICCPGPSICSQLF